MEERLKKIKLKKEKEIDDSLNLKKAELENIEKELKAAVDKSKKTKTLI